MPSLWDQTQGSIHAGQTLCQLRDKHHPSTKTRLSKADIFLTRRPENEEKTNQKSFQFRKPGGKGGSGMAVPALASPRMIPGSLEVYPPLPSSVLRNHRVTEQAFGTHAEAMKGRSLGQGDSSVGKMFAAQA